MKDQYNEEGHKEQDDSNYTVNFNVKMLCCYIYEGEVEEKLTV